MNAITQAPATLDDLARVGAKAELISGRIVPFKPAGGTHNRVASNIAVALRQYARTRTGRAYTDNMGFGLRRKLPNGRESFSPDAAYHAGPFPPDDSGFVIGGPTFAVEVRRPDESGPVAEAAMAEKRDD